MEPESKTEHLVPIRSRSGWQSVHDYGRERKFARHVAKIIRQNISPFARDKVYNEAVWRLFIEKPQALLELMFHEDKVQISFRNCERDKKGKVTRCEAGLIKRPENECARIKERIFLEL